MWGFLYSIFCLGMRLELMLLSENIGNVE
jgi:hypothetical protein